MRRLPILLLLSALVMLSPALAGPCGTFTATQCATWCGPDAESSCTATSTSFCLYHNRSFIECGYVRVVVSCTCTLIQTPPPVPYASYETPSLEGNGFLVECDNGVGVDEETGNAYCLPPESEP